MFMKVHPHNENSHILSLWRWRTGTWGEADVSWRHLLLQTRTNSWTCGNYSFSLKSRYNPFHKNIFFVRTEKRLSQLVTSIASNGIPQRRDSKRSPDIKIRKAVHSWRLPWQLQARRSIARWISFLFHRKQRLKHNNRSSRSKTSASSGFVKWVCSSVNANRWNRHSLFCEGWIGSSSARTTKLRSPGDPRGHNTKERSKQRPWRIGVHSVEAAFESSGGSWSAMYIAFPLCLETTRGPLSSGV